MATKKVVKEEIKETIEKVEKTAEATAKKVEKAAETTAKKATTAAKATAKKATTTAKKATATAEKAVKAVTPEVFVQFQGKEVPVAELVEKAKAAYKEEHKGVVRGLKLYVKPEDNACYSVVGDVTGKIEL